MKISELVKDLEEIKSKCDEDFDVIIETNVNGVFRTNSTITNIHVYADNDSEGNWVEPVCTLETVSYVMGNVDLSEILQKEKGE